MDNQAACRYLTEQEISCRLEQDSILFKDMPDDRLSTLMAGVAASGAGLLRIRRTTAEPGGYFPGSDRKEGELMITALRAECMKTKRRFLWLLPFCVVFFEFLWTITNSYLRKPEIAAEGCYTLLYQFPLYNTIFMPLTLAAMASRLCDAENKGNTYKLLCTMQQKKIIFDAKLLMGIFYVLIFTALEAGVIPLLANLLPFTQKLPVRHYLAFLAVFFLVSLVLFLLQQSCPCSSPTS